MVWATATANESSLPHFSALTWRIIAFNALALIVLMGGVILVQTSSRGLVEERLLGIQEQAAIIASTLAEYATDSNAQVLKINEAEPLLRQLITPTRLRGRLYLPSGQLALDTRNLLARNIVQIQELPPLDRFSRIMQQIKRIYEGIMGVRPFAQLQPYYEAGKDGRVYREVDLALEGTAASAERVDDRNRLVLSVAAPIQQKPFRTIYGVLFLSTEGGDIDGILRQERATLIEVFAVAFVVMLLSSLYLAGTIAEPVRRLAAATDRVRFGRGTRREIPNFPDRDDEIGDLADSLKAMTTDLYDRIDAIESFAADVAHELKNPLTSLSSAIEMFSRAKDEEARAKLLTIIRGDVKRIDRLITDISDASRLDAEMSRESPGPVDLSRLLTTIIDIYRMTENANGVTFQLSDQLPHGARVRGRDERLGQVFRNLIDNAMSFSPQGGAVTVTAVRHGHNARISVEDEGPGIPPDNLESIFQRFYTERPGESFGRNSGLGLSIARQIIAGAGGRIWAENRTPDNTQGGGARLMVELPLETT
jgi:two-component system sensor histidine kinase ChvG